MGLAPRADGAPELTDCGELEAKQRQLFPDPVKVTYRSNVHKAEITGVVLPVRVSTEAYSDAYGVRHETVEMLPPDETQKVLTGLTVVAKGPRKTFKAPVLIDSGVNAFYRNGAMGLDWDCRSRRGGRSASIHGSCPGGTPRIRPCSPARAVGPSRSLRPGWTRAS